MHITHEQHAHEVGFLRHDVVNNVHVYTFSDKTEAEWFNARCQTYGLGQHELVSSYYKTFGWEHPQYEVQLIPANKPTEITPEHLLALNRFNMRVGLPQY